MQSSPNCQINSLTKLDGKPDIDFLNSFMSLKNKNKGISDGYVLPLNVSIELTEDSENLLLPKIYNEQKENYKKIKYLKSIDHLGYKGFSTLLSENDLTLNFMYKDQLLFQCPVPKGVFNPFSGPIGAMFVEKIFHGDIEVKGKNVIDLGCGCGNFGISALIMGANEVLFTDVHKLHLPLLQNNPFVNQNSNNIIVSQDLLSESFRDAKLLEHYDVLISSTPTFSMMTESNVDKTKSDGLFTSNDFYSNLAEQSFALLKKGGLLSLWSMIPNFSAQSLYNFLMKFTEYYHISDFRIVSVEKQTKLGIFSPQEAKDDNFYTFYEIKKNLKASEMTKEDIRAKFQEIREILKNKKFSDLVADFNDFIDNIL